MQQPTNPLDTVKITNGVAEFPDSPSLTSPERIQRAIIAAFVPTIHDILEDEPITLHNLQKLPDYASYRAQFLRALRTNRITSVQEAKYLLTIPYPPKQIGTRAIYEQISFNQYEKQILAVVTGHNSTNWQDVVASDIDTFLEPPHRNEIDYRTPVGFADMRRRFLVEIKASASPTQLDRYIAAMDSLETKLYGDRFVHYREFEALRREAASLNESVAGLPEETAPTPDGISTAKATTQPTDVPLPEPTPDPAEPSTSLAPDMPSSRLAPVSDEHRDQLVAHAVIEGDDWRQGGQTYRLDVASLVTAGLVPKFEANINGQAIYLTNLFPLTSDQMAALAYIPANGATKVRAYYRNKLTGLWHYLPDYIRDISGEGIGSFGIGYDTRSSVLPIPLQSALNQIERNRNILDLSSTNPDFLFAGTAPAYDTTQAFRDASTRGALRGDFYQEVSPTAYNIDSANLIRPGRRKNAPQLISFSANNIPNFNQPIAHFSIYTTLTGQTMGEGFPSEDRQTFWLFFSDYRGRTWIAHSELSCPVTSTGCRKEWLLPTDASTPLYESTLLADGYGDEGDVRTGNLISMWNNYLSKIPILVDYARRVAARKSDR